ncbi:unnamed protein product [Ambrosiozyma monospora]|uniref:Unnamed protein product n=1 Tax=Ambrosiozyma monospora TaxID=43982 RepID=A0ACB5T3G5_AMBMO|nr:unnamed protein product [Ambrosiozyma monospora]
MFGFAKKLVSTIDAANQYLVGPETNTHLDKLGLRVLNVEKGSIGEAHGFESWFDFILEINNHPITAFLTPSHATSANPYSASSPYPTDGVEGEAVPIQVTGTYVDPNSVDFTNLINYMGHEINVLKNDLHFKVWSAKGGVLRHITIANSSFSDVTSQQLDDVNISSNVPLKVETDKHGLTTVTNSAFRQLKLSLQLSSLAVSQFVWHVLKVQPNSPAYAAGIMPDEYIINSEGATQNKTQNRTPVMGHAQLCCMFTIMNLTL